MRKKRLLAVLMSVIILFGLLSGGINAFALLTVETQFSYDSANLSWLKDLIVKEDMTNIGGMSERVEYQAKSKYPYRETAESFSEEIAYYQILYTLDENMANVVYLYMLDLAESFASSAGSGYSDEFIRSYLESIGIVYPSGAAGESTETKIVARALFSIISADSGYVVKRGTGLYEAFTAYLAPLLGVSNGAILRFDGDADLSDLKEYVLAACKYVLFSAGYPVSADTSEEEVYRLIAIMTIRSQGISIDSGTATFEEIKNKYLCAMMCKIYGVSIDTNAFSAAVSSGRLDFYMLQLIGKKEGVTVKDSVSYSEAFDLICKNSDYFDLEKGEFYADVYEYDVPLKYKRNTIWVYPQTLGVTSSSDGTKVSVSINGTKVRENYYVDISLDSSKATEPVVILVEYTDANGKKTSSSYQLNIIQGSSENVKPGTVSQALAGVKDVVSQMMEEMGMNSSFSGIVSTIPFELPERFLSIASLVVPSFDSSSLGSGFLQRLFGYGSGSSNANTDKIGGVGGLDSFNSSGSVQSMDFNTGINNMQFQPLPAENTTNQANAFVIPDQQLTYPTPAQVSNGGNGNWFKSFMSDTPTVIVLAVVLVVTFGACFFLFTKILKERERTGGGKKNKKS